jgi:hypothetical protein
VLLVAVEQDDEEVLEGRSDAGGVDEGQGVVVGPEPPGVVGQRALDHQQQVDLVLHPLHELPVDVEASLARAGQVDQAQARGGALEERMLYVQAAHGVARADAGGVRRAG